MNKRPADDSQLALVPDKRARLTSQNVATNTSRQSDGATVVHRRHFLKGPVMLLTGHDAEVYAAKFHPSGTSIASAGADRSIYLWSTREDCENYAIFRCAHQNTITDLAFSSDGDKLFSSSADKTVLVWDLKTGSRLKKLRNHHSFVNSISVPQDDPNLLVSVGDDCQINVWDVRKRRCALSFKESYPLVATAFSKTGEQVFVGGVETTVKVWDLRQGLHLYSMPGHSDMITGMSLSSDGCNLLSNSLDNTLKSWDVRPNAPENKLLRTFIGHEHNFEKNMLRCSWSPAGNMVTAGSSDRIVYIWSYSSGDILYKLPGHRGTVNEVVFSPSTPMVLSCSSDKNLYLGEISYDLL